MSAAEMVLMAATGAVGFLVGIAYFAGLSRTVGLILGGASCWRSVGRYVLRLAAIVATFALIVQLGPGALLAAFVGFLIARTVAIRVMEPPACRKAHRSSFPWRSISARCR